ncbi:MAG TPA: SDR family oxidoreductase [Solirubrobacterales bacterium]|jgi:NAD(P)-dependent dehydrogenase (short-subunit alcohol dehydrogenase family)
MTGIALVTGASAGVGRATVRRLAADGYDVALLARGHEALEAACAEVEGLGRRALVLPTDVADESQVEEAADRVESELGPIDVWVNNAMTTVFSPFMEIEPDEFRRATEVTYLGVVWGTRAALQRMVPRDRGSIVMVGSALAYRGIPLQSAYCGSKHAIKGFFESVRSELLHDGSRVRLSLVDLPAVNTPQFDHCRTRLPKQPQPVPPIYQPEVAADAIAWAARSGEREVYVGAPTWKTIWGERIAPGIGDHYLAKNGYSGQQADEPVNGDRPDNLFEPVEGDRGAHGRFEDGTRERSPLLWLGKHRRAIGLAALAGLGATAAAAIGKGD